MNSSILVVLALVGMAAAIPIHSIGGISSYAVHTPVSSVRVDQSHIAHPSVIHAPALYARHIGGHTISHDIRAQPITHSIGSPIVSTLGIDHGIIGSRIIDNGLIGSSIVDHGIIGSRIIGNGLIGSRIIDHGIIGSRIIDGHSGILIR